MNIRAEIIRGEGRKPILKEKRRKQSETKALTDIAISREESRRTNNRDQDRFRLTGAVFRVTYQGTEFEAELINLSGGGAMIAADLLPNIGERLHLHLGEGGEIECVVRWIKAGRLGLEFAHETQLQCSDDEQASLLRDVIARDFPEERFAARRSGSSAEAPVPEPDQADQRSAIRHPLIWWGDLHHGSHSWHVRLRNISATGALVECPGRLRIDSEVLLDMGKAGALTASVTWAVGDHVGLKFDEPFDLQCLSQTKPGVTPPMWLRPAYLEGQVEADSAWDPSWERLSVDDLRTQLEGFLKR
jgi:PilZ domain-containing protein